MSFFKDLFGSSPNPEEEVKKWRRELSKEGRTLDRQVQKIRLEEKKTINAAKAAAKKNDMVSVKILSKEILHSRKAVRRLTLAKTQMNSISMQLQQQVSQLKLSGSLQKSTQIMSQMNQLMRVSDIQQSMMSMSKEMMKAGLLDEMINDTLDDALDDGIEETELDDEVQKVVLEVVQGQMTGAHVGATKLPAQTQQESVEEEEDGEDLMAKYMALKGS